MITPTQKRAAQSIINIFETGEVLGEYGSVTVLSGDTGHLTFGRSQTTLGSGNLGGLIERYCANAGARFGARLRAWLPQLQAKATTLDDDRKLHNVLRATADDPIMRETQDVFFDLTYWEPALKSADRLGLATPLGIAVVYDGHVHGSFKRMRDETIAADGNVAQLGEQAWVGAYVRRRRAWLASHPNALLQKTVYRMDAFLRLIELGAWGLEIPLVVRGREISSVTLNAVPPGCYDGPVAGSRILTAQPPLQRGLDVRLVQLALSDRDLDVRADGVFGSASATALRTFQQATALPATGVATPEVIARLLA